MQDQLGHYQILRELGRGGMGVVYLAHDQRIGRHVAIKTILLHDSADRDQLRDALLREARAAGQLSHPNIITIYQVGEERGLLYLVMEYVEGGSLADRLTLDQPTDFRWACGRLKQIAAALDAAHAARVVHRDIKPSNILLSGPTDFAKVADFGLARTFVSGHSQTAFAGTPSFMSPEQVYGRQLDGRSDQFALAVLAYRLFTGYLPFHGENLMALAFQIINAEPGPAHLLNPAVSPSVSAVLARGMEKQRERRFPTCTAFAEAIATAIDGPTQSTDQPTVTLKTPPPKILPRVGPCPLGAPGRS